MTEFRDLPVETPIETFEREREFWADEIKTQARNLFNNLQPDDLIPWRLHTVLNDLKEAIGRFDECGEQIKLRRNLTPS